MGNVTNINLYPGISAKILEKSPNCSPSVFISPFSAVPASGTVLGNPAITYTPGYRKLDSTGIYSNVGSITGYQAQGAIAFAKDKDPDIILAIWESTNKNMGFILSGGGNCSIDWDWVSKPTSRILNGDKKIKSITSEELKNYKVSQWTTTQIGSGVTYYLPVLLVAEKIGEEPEPEPDPCSIGPGLNSTSIAKCIDASSQKYLDGRERDWRKSVENVNSINA